MITAIYFCYILEANTFSCKQQGIFKYIHSSFLCQTKDEIMTRGYRARTNE